MQADTMALGRSKVVVAIFLIIGVLLGVVGCASSYPQSYYSSYQSKNGPGLIMPGLRIEHNLLNNKYRSAKDEPESDWAG